MRIWPERLFSLELADPAIRSNLPQALPEFVRNKVALLLSRREFAIRLPPNVTVSINVEVSDAGHRMASVACIIDVKTARFS